MKPNAELYTDNATYLRALVQESGLSINKAADRIGISRRSLAYYLNGQRKWPYTVQYALESLVSEPRA